MATDTFSKGSLSALTEFVDPSKSNPDSASGKNIISLLQTPEVIPITSQDGKVTLYCAIYRPDQAVYGPGPYPAIVSVYGGPHVQRVMNNWMLAADLRAQRLAQDGCVVIKCDNRGSSRRGLEFEGAVKWNMGLIEVDDQRVSV